MSRTKVLVTLLLLSPFIALFPRNYYVWQLEKYGGTWCHLKDNYQDRWVYVEREDMMNALMLLGYPRSPVFDSTGQYRDNEFVKITPREDLANHKFAQKKRPWDWDFNQMHSLFNPLDAVFYDLYDRYLLGLNPYGRKMSGCFIYERVVFLKKVGL